MSYLRSVVLLHPALARNIDSPAATALYTYLYIYIYLYIFIYIYIYSSLYIGLLRCSPIYLDLFIYF